MEVEGGEARRRYFVSLIDESIYKKGVFQRLSRWHKVREGEGDGFESDQEKGRGHSKPRQERSYSGKVFLIATLQDYSG